MSGDCRVEPTCSTRFISVATMPTEPKQHPWMTPFDHLAITGGMVLIPPALRCLDTAHNTGKDHPPWQLSLKNEG